MGCPPLPLKIEWTDCEKELAAGQQKKAAERLPLEGENAAPAPFSVLGRPLGAGRPRGREHRFVPPRRGGKAPLTPGEMGWISACNPGADMV